MSTVSLATHAGITVRYLEMIEADGKVLSVPVLRKLAKVLGVCTLVLLGEAPSENHEGPIDPRLAEVERALCTYFLLGLADPRALPTLDELGAQITAAAQAWYTLSTKYSDVLGVLPELIVHSERAVYGHDRSVQVCRQISELYQLIREVLKVVGRIDLRGVVSDRAMRYVEETEDPLLIAAATSAPAKTMLADDMPVGWIARRGERQLLDAIAKTATTHD